MTAAPAKIGTEQIVAGKGRAAETVEDLVRENPGLWRGRSESPGQGNVIDSGRPELNSLLPGGGWPAGSVVELVVDDWGNGELQLLLPLMAALGERGKQFAMVAPPHVPHAVALEQAGIDLGRLVVVDGEVGDEDRWWCAEKLLRHDRCELVMLWPRNPRPEQVRRLLLAVGSGNGLGVVFRRGRPVDTPVSLRLKVGYCGPGIGVEVLKSRFSWDRGRTVITDDGFSVGPPNRPYPR